MAADWIDAFAPVLAPSYAIGLVLVHLFAARLTSIDVVPRRRWLSLAGGVSIAYVFVHVLPEVGAAAEAIDRSETPLAALDRHVYLVSLAGFVVFYGLEGLVRRGPNDDRATATEARAVFWLHAGSFATYNALVGYLLVHRDDQGVASLTLFFVAMALHFVVNDHGLRQHHGRTYRRYGRWVLAGAILAGFGVGRLTPVSESLFALLFAFLAGGIVLNVIKEELPAERRSRFWAFALGAAGYTALLLAV